MAERAPSSRTGDLLGRAFSIIREDVPAAHERMVARAPRTMVVQIDADRLVLTRAAEALEISADERADAEGEVRVKTTSETLLRLVDGETTLLAALYDGSIFVSGDVQALAEAQAALLAFLQGAVRSAANVTPARRGPREHRARGIEETDRPRGRLDREDLHADSAVQEATAVQEGTAVQESTAVQEATGGIVPHGARQRARASGGGRAAGTPSAVEQKAGLWSSEHPHPRSTRPILGSWFRWRR